MKKKTSSANGQIMVSIITMLVTMVMALIINYVALPAWNIHSSGFWWYWIIIGIISIIVSGISQAICNGRSYDYGSKEKRSWRIPLLLITVTAIVLVAFFVTSIPSWECFHADEYANLIKVEDGSFEQDIPQVKDTAVIVDMKTAQKLGDRTIGTIAHASWYEADDEYDLIKISNEYYRISSVMYNGFFAYNKAKNEGIPGYILVNAATQEAKYVELEEGMKYAPSAFWSYDLQRHLHNQYPTYIMGKSFFEVDDDYVPYWITNVRTAKIGMRGAPVATSVLVTNAITGETTEYSMEEIPEWVDHANSVAYLMQLIEWHYRYQNGWWNPSKTNMYYTAYKYKDSKTEEEENEYTPFDGYNSMLDAEGNIWFYTGITPANSAETNVGFVLASPKTGQVKYYDCNGAEESSAQAAAEGLVQNLSYSASFPNMVNVEGIPTYFMVLKDNAGLVQRYALCNVAQYSRVVQSDSIKETIKLYKEKIGLSEDELQEEETNTVEEQPVVQHDTKSMTGIVSEVREAQIAGYTYYYFVLEDNENIFMSSIQNSNLQPLKLKKDAHIEVEFYLEDDIAIVTKITIK